MSVFNAYEVFEIAEQIERNGSMFYSHAAQCSFSSKAKELLSRLACMEREHEKLFTALKEKFSLKGDDTFPDSENQAISYIKAIAGGKVFGSIEDISKKLRADASYDEIIETALGFEKNSVVYFTALKTLLSDRSQKDKIESLIEQELSHISMLLEEKKNSK